MKVKELIADLEGLDPNMDVRIASQPSWALEYEITSVAEVPSSGKFMGAVYLVEG